MRIHWKRAVSLLAIIATVTTSTVGAWGRGDDDDDAQEMNFPFQDQAFQFRLNQGFFKTSGELFEDILKASGLVDKTNTLKIVDEKNDRSHFLRYRKLKSAIKLSKNALTATLAIDIADSRFFVGEQMNGSLRCRMSLRGVLQFDVQLTLAQNGSIGVSVPDEKFNDSGISVSFAECGFMGFMGNMGGASVVRSSLRGYLTKIVASMANDKELKVVAPASMDKALKAANIFVNVPSKGPLSSKQSPSQFKIDIGLQGYLSNAKGADRLQITNPGNEYLDQLGIQWSLNAGMEAESKNIYDPKYKSQSESSSKPFPAWGYVPYKRSGKKIDFDAGLMIRTSFLKAMFETLYQGGFFNLQIQDSLLNKKVATINPQKWGQSLGMTLPNGDKLTAENYADSRLELRLAAPPALNVKNAEEFELVVPDFYVSYYAKAKGEAKEFEVLKVRAKFNLVTDIGMDEDAHLEFKFNDRPIESFQVLSRSGIAAEVPDSAIEDELNHAVIELLNKATVEIPFLKGRKIVITSLGIDAHQKSDQALSMYLKIK